MQNESKINFRRKPYKGILSKVAAKVNDTLQNVRYQYLIGNPKILILVNAEVRRVEKAAEVAE